MSKNSGKADSCCYCGTLDGFADLRPYGPKGKMCCNPCVVDPKFPEREKIAKELFFAAIDRSAIESGVGIAMITDDGVKPFPKKKRK